MSKRGGNVVKFLRRNETILVITNKYAFATEKYLGGIPPPESNVEIVFRVVGRI